MDGAEVVWVNLEERSQLEREWLERLRVAAQQHGVGKNSVVQQIEQVCTQAILLSIGGRLHGRVHIADADLAAHIGGAKTLHGQTVCHELVVCSRKRVEEERLARRVGAERVSVEGDRRGLVDGHPGVNAVAEPRADRMRIVAKAQGRVTIQPTIAEGERRVPVVERRHRADAGLEEVVEQSVIESQAAPIHGPSAVRL